MVSCVWGVSRHGEAMIPAGVLTTLGGKEKPGGMGIRNSIASLKPLSILFWAAMHAHTDTHTHTPSQNM